MFWGLRLDPGKRYSTTVDKSFHVSMAALDCSSLKADDDVLSVMLEEGESSVPFILCNLQKQKALQCSLDLNFLTGDRITFFCKGNGVVHLSGYIVPEDEFGPFENEEGDEEEEEEDEDESMDNTMSSEKDEKKKLNGVVDKRKLKQAGPSNKKQLKLEDYSGDDSEDSDDIDLNLEEEEGDEDEGSDDNNPSLVWDESDEMDEDSNKEDEGSDEEREQISLVTSQQKKDKKKKKKKQSQQPQQSQQSAQKQQQPPQQKKQKSANGMLPNAQQGKKDKKGGESPAANNKLNKSKSEDPSPQKKVVEGGVQIKDIKVGNGPVCVRGKQATVYYTGRFKANNKVFDSTTQGTGFKFRVGKGEVIKGWDVGVVGMKVGGKRLITCPPHMAYGQKGSPPTIPGNSTLMFEVELKSVN